MKNERKKPLNSFKFDIQKLLYDNSPLRVEPLKRLNQDCFIILLFDYRASVLRSTDSRVR